MGTEAAEQVTNSEVQTAQEIEDRLAASFEQATPDKDSKAEDIPDAEPAEGDGLEEVEYEGKTFRVAPELKEAIIHKGDYTRKSQEVAEARRNIEHQNEQIRVANMQREFEQSVAEQTQTLALIESRTKLLLSNWANISADEKQEILYLDKQREQIDRELEGKRREFGQNLQKAMGELQTKALDAVSKAIPGWKNDELKLITEHAISDGYTNQELASINDPRHIKTLWKAKEYDRIKARAQANPKPTPVVKPGPSNPMPAKVKENLAFRKEMAKATSDTQRARLIEERFAKQFGG
jgi:hypothetical protein